MSKQKQKYKSKKMDFLNMLDEKSLNIFRKFGYIFRDPVSGRLQMRVYKDKRIYKNKK